MQAQISEQAGLLYLSGIIHRETSDQVSELFNRLLDEGAPVVILSFQNVKALLSDGIRQSIALADQARKQGREFYITDLPREVKYTLQITNLLELLGHAGSTATLLQQKGIDQSTLTTLTMKAPEPEKAKAVASKQEEPQPKPQTPKKPVQDPASATSRLKAIGQREAATAKTEVKEKKTSGGIQSIAEFIIKHIPGETELQIVALLLKDTTSSINLDKFDDKLDFDILNIKEALRRLMRRKTIDALGNGVFKLTDNAEINARARDLANEYIHPDTRGKILQLLHKAEQLPH